MEYAAAAGVAWRQAGCCLCYRVHPTMPQPLTPIHPAVQDDQGQAASATLRLELFQLFSLNASLSLYATGTTGAVLLQAAAAAAATAVGPAAAPAAAQLAAAFNATLAPALTQRQLTVAAVAVASAEAASDLPPPPPPPPPLSALRRLRQAPAATTPAPPPPAQPPPPSSTPLAALQLSCTLNLTTLDPSLYAGHAAPALPARLAGQVQQASVEDVASQALTDAWGPLCSSLADAVAALGGSPGAGGLLYCGSTPSAVESEPLTRPVDFQATGWLSGGLHARVS